MSPETAAADPAMSELLNGPLYRFADWPNQAVPHGRAGVYSVWRGDEFIYVGISGRGMRATSETVDNLTTKPQKGLWGRLSAHANGRRSGDQFCIYVFDRLLLPNLTREQIERAATGQLSLDGLVRNFIRESLGYRFALTTDSRAAETIERHIQREGLNGQLPLLNLMRSGQRG